MRGETPRPREGVQDERRDSQSHGKGSRMTGETLRSTGRGPG